MQNLDLQEIRKKLDAIDKDLVALFEERMKLCADVASFKIETGKPVYDGEREKQKLEAVRQLAHGTSTGCYGAVFPDYDHQPQVSVPASGRTWKDGSIWICSGRKTGKRAGTGGVSGSRRRLQP